MCHLSGLTYDSDYVPVYYEVAEAANVSIDMDAADIANERIL